MDHGRRTRLSLMPNDFESVEVLGGGDGEVSLAGNPGSRLEFRVVIHGSLVISLAGVDLVYLGLNVVLTSIETALTNLKIEEKRGRK